MAGKNGEFVIETIALTKIFPDWWGRAKVIAVEDLNLKIHRNEIYGFLGPNGSGKTTTIKMLLNLLHPTRGKALVLGGEGRDPKITERIGYLPEESYLYRYLTARETLDFYGRLFNLPPRVRKSRIDTLLEMVGLTGMANRQVGTFSKGMARRIGLAQALINDPDLLILDEPTSGMDPIGTRQIKDLLIHLGKRGKTILLCSHLLADVEDVCDRIGILYGGKMQVEGPVRELLQQSDKRQIITNAISDAALHKIEAIVAAEQSECQVSSPMNRLEDLFVRVVTDAQQRQQRTSGAISTTAIGGFLAEEAEAEDILQRLAASKPDTDFRKPEFVELSPVQTTPSPTHIKSDLLDQLSHPPTVPTTESSAQTSRPAELPPQSLDEVRQNVLDALIDRSKKGNADTHPTRRSETPGDQNHA
ncbi:MAG: ABC transporter ATP-binding protein [Phycisphaerae bacterium]|nr:ABC transporter ATP-binding protein [Phycisphaerae bacterium]